MEPPIGMPKGPIPPPGPHGLPEREPEPEEIYAFEETEPSRSAPEPTGNASGQGHVSYRIRLSQFGIDLGRLGKDLGRTFKNSMVSLKELVVDIKNSPKLGPAAWFKQDFKEFSNYRPGLSPVKAEKLIENMPSNAYILTASKREMKLGYVTYKDENGKPATLRLYFDIFYKDGIPQGAWSVGNRPNKRIYEDFNELLRNELPSGRKYAKAHTYSERIKKRWQEFRSGVLAGSGGYEVQTGKSGNQRKLSKMTRFGRAVGGAAKAVHEKAEVAGEKLGRLKDKTGPVGRGIDAAGESLSRTVRNFTDKNVEDKEQLLSEEDTERPEDWKKEAAELHTKEALFDARNEALGYQESFKYFQKRVPPQLVATIEATEGRDTFNLPDVRIKETDATNRKFVINMNLKNGTTRGVAFQITKDAKFQMLGDKVPKKPFKTVEDLVDYLSKTDATFSVYHDVVAIRDEEEPSDVDELDVRTSPQRISNAEREVREVVQAIERSEARKQLAAMNEEDFIITQSYYLSADGQKLIAYSISYNFKNKDGIMEAATKEIVINPNGNLEVIDEGSVTQYDCENLDDLVQTLRIAEGMKEY